MQRISAGDFCGRQFSAAIQKTQPAAGKGKNGRLPDKKDVRQQVPAALRTLLCKGTYFF